MGIKGKRKKMREREEKEQQEAAARVQKIRARRGVVEQKVFSHGVRNKARGPAAMPLQKMRTAPSKKQQVPIAGYGDDDDEGMDFDDAYPDEGDDEEEEYEEEEGEFDDEEEEYDGEEEEEEEDGEQMQYGGEDDEEEEFFDDEDEEEEEEEEQQQMPKMSKSERWDYEESEYLDRIKDEHSNRKNSHLAKKRKLDDGSAVPGPWAESGEEHVAHDAEDLILTKNLSMATSKALQKGPAFANPMIGLNPDVVQALAAEGFTRMTPIQQRAIPLALNAEYDILGQAKTGSGKTLAFGIPLLHNTLDKMAASPSATVGLILGPTKELCVQIHSVLTGVSRHITSAKIKVQLITGGTRVQTERNLLRQSNIVVGTPGRVLDHVNNSKNEWSLKSLMCFVLDEADRMLAEGFARDLDGIINALPYKRHNLLFSATNSKSVRELARLSLSKSPVMIGTKGSEPAFIGKSDEISLLPLPQYLEFPAENEDVDDEVAGANTEGVDPTTGEDSTNIPSTLTQFCQIVPMADRLRSLFSFVKRIIKANNKAMVFCSTISSTQFHSMMMGSVGFHDDVLMLHGKMKHRQRLAGFEEFLKRPSGVLFCTDVAARGLDIPNIDWILQFDPPVDPTEYIHRIGRTARAGAVGSALIFLTPQETKFIGYLNRFGISLEQYVTKGPLPDIQMKLEHVLELDGGMSKSAVTAMRAYVGAYQSHILRDTFDVQNIVMKDVGLSFALSEGRAPNIPLPTNTKAEEKKDFVKGKLKSLNKTKQAAMRMYNQEKTKAQWTDEGSFVGYKKPKSR